jgi:TonB family protein
MPDAARIAQAQALEVPIVLRGAKQSDDSGKLELFTETARTVLVFENGLVLHLHSKLTVGQTIFIHNTQNGCEVLCKVLEAPGEGELGLTDLEFTKPVPDFWDANSQGAAQPAEAAAPESSAANSEPESHVPSGAPNDDPLAMMLETASRIDVPSMNKPGESSGPLREELMPAHEMAPDPSSAVAHVPDFEPAVTTGSSSASSATEPTGEQIDAALKQMSARAATPLPGSDADHTDDQKHIAALMERDARLAKFAAFKEKQAEKIQKDSATKGAAKDSPGAGPETANDAEEVGAASALRAKLAIGDKLTTGKNATYVTIAAAVLIAIAIGFIWHAMRSPFVQDNFQPAAVTPATTSAPAASAPANSAPAQPAAAPPAKSASRNSERAEKRVAANRGDVAPDDGAASARSRRSAGANNFDIPAKVLSQPQPTLPPWAVDVQVDGVVTLDVTIGENGTVIDAQVISGPRPLQREAERAVGLWQFEPARANGKPVESHMTLSVEFLPPPPPKRIY